MDITEQITELRDIPFGKEFQAYVIALAAAVTGKPKPPAAFIRNLERENSTFVTAGDMRPVLTAMKEIFAEEGYLPHRDFENRLMQKLCPDLTAGDLEQADNLIAGEYAADHLTGFLQKPLVPLSTAEAWLYANSTGKPAFMLEIDFSNMRGTNEHYERLLSEQATAGKTDHKTISEQAMAMTDEAARRICDRMTAALDAGKTKENQGYSALRTGGDEARIIISGLADHEIPPLVERLHQAIEDEVARLGLQHHPHAKAPDDPVRNGFGAAIAAIRLNGMTNLAQAVKDADEDIRAAKQAIGRQRLSQAGNTESGTLKEKIKQDFTDKHPAETPPEQRSGMASIFGHHVPDQVLSLEDIRQQSFNHLKEQLEQSRRQPGPAAWRLIKTKIERYPAIDYASGTLMPRDQPVIASIFRDVLARQQDLPERDDPPVLYGLGASLHNLSGLNETLGHEAANACLHHMANDIIIPALHKKGVPDSHFTLAHYGGGAFRAIIKDPRRISGHKLSTQTMAELAEDIEQRVRNLNNSPVAAFLNRYGIGLKPDGQSAIPETFADIPHGKPEQRPWNNGLTATTVTEELPVFDSDNHKPVRTGAMLHRIGQSLEEKAAYALAAKKPQNYARNMPPGTGRPPIPRPRQSGGDNSR